MCAARPQMSGRPLRQSTRIKETDEAYRLEVDEDDELCDEPLHRPELQIRVPERAERDESVAEGVERALGDLEGGPAPAAVVVLEEDPAPRERLAVLEQQLLGDLGQRRDGRLQPEARDPKVPRVVRAQRTAQTCDLKLGNDKKEKVFLQTNKIIHKNKHQQPHKQTNSNWSRDEEKSEESGEWTAKAKWRLRADTLWAQRTLPSHTHTHTPTEIFWAARASPTTCCERSLSCAQSCSKMALPRSFFHA